MSSLQSEPAEPGAALRGQGDGFRRGRGQGSRGGGVPDRTPAQQLRGTRQEPTGRALHS